MKKNFYSAQLNKFFRVCALFVCALQLSISVCGQCTWYYDGDSDGFGNPAITQNDPGCVGPNFNYVSNNSDCDDTQFTYPDNDGDGWGGGLIHVPCGLPYFDCDDTQWTYIDNDGDGFGNGFLPHSYCGVFNNTDCDDTQWTYPDNDGDGWGGGSINIPCGLIWFDCDDTQWTYADSDNDGWTGGPPVPCGSPDNSDCDPTHWTFFDRDGDGWGGDSLVACGGLPDSNFDCDDYDASLHPVPQYIDNDLDGYGTSFIAIGNALCNNLPIPPGISRTSDDCDDSPTGGGIHPGATEICDGIDNDCNGTVDEGSILTVDAGPNKIVYYGYPDSACAKLQSSSSGGVAPRTLTWSTGSHASFINVCPTATTTYYLTITDASNCTAVDSVKVCVMDVRCGSSMNKVIICHGTGSASNPFVTLCVDIEGAKFHFKKHSGEQLGSCGTVKTCSKAGPRAKTDETSDYVEQVLFEGSTYLAAFPNPFSDNTTIRFILPEDNYAKVRVYDISGKVVAELYEGEAIAGNIYEVNFDASRYTNGIYFLALNNKQGERLVKKLVLAR